MGYEDKPREGGPVSYQWQFNIWKPDGDLDLCMGHWYDYGDDYLTEQHDKQLLDALISDLSRSRPSEENFFSDTPKPGYLHRPSEIHTLLPADALFEQTDMSSFGTWLWDYSIGMISTIDF